MKKIFQTLILILITNTMIMAQHGFKLEKEIEIAVSTDELWEMIGPGFVNVYQWSSNVDHASGKGSPEFEGAVCSERYCDVNVKGFNKISEKLYKYDQEKMILAYEVFEGMPSFVTGARNEWSIKKAANGNAILVMQAEFESKGFMGSITKGMMKKKMDKTLDTVLMDAKIYAETGEISPAKRERVEQLAKKQKKAA